VKSFSTKYLSIIRIYDYLTADSVNLTVLTAQLVTKSFEKIWIKG